MDLDAARRLAAVLRARGVVHELIVYPGADHVMPARSPEMLANLRRWYRTHRLID